MDTPVAVRSRDGSGRVDAADVDASGIAGLDTWRIPALIASGSLAAAGSIYAGINAFAVPDPGSAAAATEQILRSPLEPSVLGTAIFIVLIMTFIGAAAGFVLRRHAG